jgi:glycerophosphoryl diester phosphodiesterase
MAAFSACEEAGIGGLELDIHLTSDGGLVIIHDHTLSRTAGGEGRVEEMELETLKSIDIGSWFSPDFDGEMIPTLQKLFSTYGDRFYYDIELKDETHGDSGLGGAAVQAVVDAKLEHRSFFSSFNPYPLIAAKRAAPEIPTAIIYSNDKEVPPILRHGLGAAIAGVSIRKPAWRQAGGIAVPFYRHIEGRPVIPWTVDDRELGRQLLGRGVDGLISNDPAVHR